jgi:poly(beta-D-mannuronate) lyase
MPQQGWNWAMCAPRRLEAQFTRSSQGESVAAVCALFLVLLCGPASACQPTPPAVRDLGLSRFYSDKAGSITSADLLADHRAAVEPLTVFVRQVASDADKAVRRTSAKAAAEAASCALLWLASWARSEALLGAEVSRQGEYQRKWDFTGLALAYLKVRRFATPDQRATIEPWLKKLADTATRFFDDTARKRNNHWYWLGLGIAATALATDSEPHWLRARGIMKDAAADIRADGALPMELERKGRALHYHAFALMPLVVMAELARSRGEDWYGLSDNALHRLAMLTMTGLASPTGFAGVAGAPQQEPVNPGAGWLTLYKLRFAGRIPVGVPESAPGHRWLGGDTRLLLQAVGTAR